MGNGTILSVKSNYNQVAKCYDKLYSTKRHKVEDKIIFNINPRLTTLDLGCGTGTLLTYNPLPRNKYMGFDLSKEMVKIAKIKHRKNQIFCRDLKSYNPPFKYQQIVGIFGIMNYIGPRRICTILKQNLKPEGVFYFVNYNPSTYKPLAHKSKIGERKITEETIKKVFGKHFDVNIQYFSQDLGKYEKILPSFCLSIIYKLNMVFGINRNARYMIVRGKWLKENI